MAISVSPGRRSSPGFCHNRRHGKRSAQKQIICPIYRGWVAARPYRQGLEPEILACLRRMRPPQGVRVDSLLEGYLITANLVRPGAFPTNRFSTESPKYAAYSAAARIDLGFAAEIMKSWMRGKISDLKREPLNTP